MFDALSCLAVQHDWRLVTLAGFLCLLSSLCAVSLVGRARATRQRFRAIWLVTAAVAAGFGIWSTHFIAMLAYDAGVPTAYNVGLTGLSLIAAIAVTGIALHLALTGERAWRAPLAGVLIGFGIAAMHYLGMAALEIPGKIEWNVAIVATSVLLGSLFACLAMLVLFHSHLSTRWGISASLLTAAVLLHHFTAMAAVTITPNPASTAGELSLSPIALAIVIASLASMILGVCLAAAAADRRLARKNFQLDAALHNMGQGLAMFDATEKLVICNSRFIEMYRLSPQRVKPGISFDAVLALRHAAGTLPGDPDAFLRDYIKRVAGGLPTSRTVELPDGRMIAMQTQPMAGGGWVATHEDITQKRKSEARIQYLARHDALTDLPNRHHFQEQLNASLKRGREAAHLAVLFLDLDRFKHVNDTLGHPCGDALLKAVAARLRACVREADCVGRLGGDEFAVVQMDGGEPQAPAMLAQRLITALSAPYDVDGHQVVIGTSVGIALAPADADSADELLKKADLALYRAKTDGRGTYRFFEASMDARMRARRELELSLRAALVRAEFSVHYQPIIDIQTKEVRGFEALLRWRHPTRGLVAPADFIPLAEEIGLIVPIGEWVLRQACADAVFWPKDTQIAVNLSPVQFKTGNLVETVEAALTASGLSPHRLELEITEGILLENTDATLAKLHELRALGVRIAMDDFGTGYSSLSYLRSFPFDKIKIDRSFINDLGQREDSLAIIRAVTGLGSSLQIATTAEGVETQEQFDRLKREGCTQAQGFLFSAALPASELGPLLARTSSLRAVA
jgi:diguanylate cyclase (GGDEF)-like protein